MVNFSVKAVAVEKELRNDAKLKKNLFQCCLDEMESTPLVSSPPLKRSKLQLFENKENDQSQSYVKHEMPGKQVQKNRKILGKVSYF